MGRHRGAEVQVELLCPSRSGGGIPEGPTASTAAEVNVGHTGEITALALGFGHLVVDDTVIVERRVESTQGSLTYPFPVAGLTSWLCLKWDAITRRAKAKDAYDVVWVVNALGPERAAEEITKSRSLAGEHADEVRRCLIGLVADQFADVESVGPRSYAAFLGAVDNNHDRRHALGAMAVFAERLAALEVIRSMR